jgi:hypothetical protein
MKKYVLTVVQVKMSHRPISQLLSYVHRTESNFIIPVSQRVVAASCDELITRPEESYRLCVCLIVCDIETSTMSRLRPELGCCATGNGRKKIRQRHYFNTGK